MRESIGATWIFSICLTFIILFTAYLAISVNYAKAFRIKSDIISMIEENEGYNSGLGPQISSYLLNEGYASYGKCDGSTTDSTGIHNGNWDWISSDNFAVGASGKYNICIYKLSVNSSDSQKGDGPKAYYRVKAFFKFDLPLIGAFTTFPVSGETKLIRDVAGQN